MEVGEGEGLGEEGGEGKVGGPGGGDSGDAVVALDEVAEATGGVADGFETVGEVGTRAVIARDEGVGYGDYRGYAVHYLVGEDAAHLYPAVDGGGFELGADVVEGDDDAVLAGAGGEEGGVDGKVADGVGAGTRVGEKVGEWCPGGAQCADVGEGGALEKPQGGGVGEEYVAAGVGHEEAGGGG